LNLHEYLKNFGQGLGWLWMGCFSDTLAGNFVKDTPVHLELECHLKYLLPRKQNITQLESSSHINVYVFFAKKKIRMFESCTVTSMLFSSWNSSAGFDSVLASRSNCCSSMRRSDVVSFSCLKFVNHCVRNFLFICQLRWKRLFEFCTCVSGALFGPTGVRVAGFGFCSDFCQCSRRGFIFQSGVLIL